MKIDRLLWMILCFVSGIAQACEYDVHGQDNERDEPDMHAAWDGAAYFQFKKARHFLNNNKLTRLRRVLMENKDAASQCDDDTDKTLLMRAMQADRSDAAGIVDMFRKAGADLNQVDRRGRTALMYAARQGKAGAVKELSRLGAYLDRFDKAGRTALMYAAWSGNKKVVRELLKEKACMNIVDDQKRTALMHAARHGEVGVMRILLASKVDSSLRDNQELNALEILIDFWKNAVTPGSIYSPSDVQKNIMKSFVLRGIDCVGVDLSLFLDNIDNI